MATNHDFSYDHYLEGLEAARRGGYRIATFEEARRNKKGRMIVLRHDIDISLESAVSLAELEARNGIKATYLPMLHSPFYSLMADTEGRVPAILSRGHKLGYHFDSGFFSTFASPQEGLSAEIDFIERTFGTKVSAYSQHNPSVDGFERVTSPRYIDAYTAAETLGLKYISDSVQNWREGCFCGHLGRDERMQVLIHPEWWTKEGKDRTAILEGFRRGQEQSLAALYDWLDRLHSDYLKSPANRRVGRTDARKAQ